MKKRNLSIVAFSMVLLASAMLISCEKEILTEEPEAYYDKGESLKINDCLVLLNEDELTHNGGEQGISYDASTFELRIDTITVETSLDTGLVLNIDREDDVLLRRITQMEKVNGEYILQTSDGYINDVFDNVDLTFDFSPEYSNQQMSSKSLCGAKKEALSKALTDDSNNIHPSEIRLIIGDTRELLFSVEKNIGLNQTKSTKNTNNSRVGFEHQFNTDMTLVSAGPIKLVLEDLGFSWYSDLKADLTTETKYAYTTVGIPYTSLKKRVKIKPPYYYGARFDVTASDMDIEAWFDAALVAEGEVPLVNETDPLLVPFTIQFEFPVGAVPVLIGVEFALDLGTEISLDGKAKVSTGYTVKYNIPKLMIGAHCAIDGLSFNSGANHDFQEGSIVEQDFHPLKIEAMATLKQVYTLKPTMGFSLYRVAGPEVNLSIGAEFDFSVGGGVSLSLDDSEAPQAYIGWGGKLSTKIGAGGGAWIDAFGVLNKHWDIPTLTLLPSIPIWKTPESMEDLTDSDFSNT